MFCCDGVLRNGTVFGMIFLYASYVLLAPGKQRSLVSAKNSNGQFLHGMLQVVPWHLEGLPGSL